MAAVSSVTPSPTAPTSFTLTLAGGGSAASARPVAANQPDSASTATIAAVSGTTRLDLVIA